MNKPRITMEIITHRFPLGMIWLDYETGCDGRLLTSFVRETNLGWQGQSLVSRIKVLLDNTGMREHDGVKRIGIGTKGELISD